MWSNHVHVGSDVGEEVRGGRLEVGGVTGEIGENDSCFCGTVSGSMEEGGREGEGERERQRQRQRQRQKEAGKGEREKGRERERERRMRGGGEREHNV